MLLYLATQFPRDNIWMLLWAVENHSGIAILGMNFGRAMILMHTAFYLYFPSVKFLLMSCTKTKRNKQTQKKPKNNNNKKNPNKNPQPTKKKIKSNNQRKSYVLWLFYCCDFLDSATKYGNFTISFSPER